MIQRSFLPENGTFLLPKYAPRRWPGQSPRPASRRSTESTSCRPAGPPSALAGAHGPIAPSHALIDGTHCPRLPCSVAAIIGGDGKVAAIAAASILAKTARDAGMLALHARYPQYGFDRHMGYPTALHLQALREHGASPHHRRSYAPVARLSQP